MGGPAHREADTLDLELGIHEMGWMDGMLLVGVCASVYLMRCPSFWSRPLSGYLFGIDWSTLSRVVQRGAVQHVHLQCTPYSRQYCTRRVTGTQDGACSSITDGDDHDAEWSEGDGNQRTSGHQTRTSQTQPVP
ncbi:unnamed protein product [Fusarium graminearum]|nr:hypothetical protein FG05_13720 [Fusarium graminearum]CAF3516921.1 unnamed protein product [Fusarium graminearum]CAF3562360.1 unnamed protein product [Fusarium graminearum]CAG1973582.1 unnamed protein product [Fusarium graminearum]CAG1998329.1 unnamed protein product [Fusarium graminearum]